MNKRGVKKRNGRQIFRPLRLQKYTFWQIFLLAEKKLGKYDEINTFKLKKIRKKNEIYLLWTVQFLKKHAYFRTVQNLQLFIGIVFF